MNFGAPRQTVERLKKEYPKGTRVELISMDDPYTRMTPGSQGTVTGVDDIGTIHVAWDNGHHLGIAWGEDACKRI